MGIFTTVLRCALISKAAGGIGLSITDLRPENSLIRSSGGYTTGLAPVAKILNDTAKYVDQGGGKRKGAFSLWAEPWIGDIFTFLGLKSNSHRGSNSGIDEVLCKDLFFGLWNPDFFFKRMLNGDKDWYLMDPNYCKGLSDSWGFEQEMLYEWYIQKGMGKKVSLKQLWGTIITTSFDTGTPYMLAADQANRLSNQNNYETKIKSSNLCTEIIEHTDNDRVSVCNLASLNLPRFVETDADGKRFFNWEKFAKVIKVAIRNLNQTIDLNVYPIEEAKNTNLIDRPVALGVSGQAKLFALLGLPWESDEAITLNREIWEAMYFNALSASVEIAKVHGPYRSWNLNGGSHLRRGIFHWELWDKNNVKANQFLDESEYKIRTDAGRRLPVEFVELYKGKYKAHRSWQLDGVKLSGKWDWEVLRKDVVEFGARNSLLLAAMPTASTAQIFANPEGIEPYPALIAVRYTGISETVLIPDEFIDDLEERGLYTKEIIDKIKENDGSIQNISEIPTDLKMIYKIQNEIPRSVLLEMAKDRQIFCDQSQSFSMYFDNNFSEMDTDDESTSKVRDMIQKVSNYYLNAWKMGLITIIYYNRQRRVGAAFKMTLGADAMKKNMSIAMDVSEKPGDLPKSEIKQVEDDDEEEVYVPLGACNLQNNPDCKTCQ
jgi:ribonucleoside-diphosphate reductase alpha subunit